MDLIEVIKGIFSGMNIGQMIAFVVGGMFIKMVVDVVLNFFLAKYWPDKALKIVLSKVEWFDNNVLDKLKEKYPKTGKLLEKKIVKFLDSAANVILDK